MKLLAGIALSVSVLVGETPLQRPEPFLKEGNVIRLLITQKSDEEGSKRSPATLTIKSVVATGSQSKILATLSHYGKNNKVSQSYRMEYACDSVCFYAHTTNWCYNSIDESPEYREETLGDSIVYPLGMKAGDTLKSGAALKKTITKGGSSSLYMTIKNRKVISLDTISTPFGKTEAFRIENTISTRAVSDFEVYGNNDDSYSYVMIEWFNPSIGVVMSEYRFGKGNSRIIMESYK